jgi:hypothetical protein
LLRRPDGTWDRDFERIYFMDIAAPVGSTCESKTEIGKDRIGDAQIHLDLVSEKVAWFASLSETSVRLK